MMGRGRRLHSRLAKRNANYFLYNLEADPGRCEFLVRGVDETPGHLRPCNRTLDDHPVKGHGKYENHKFMLVDGRRVA